MRTVTPAALLLLAALPAPAFATQGQLCRPVAGSGPSVGVVIGSGAGSVIAGVNLTEGGVTRSTFGDRAALGIGQSWIDEQRLWIDLTDSDVLRYEARLRVQYVGRGRGRHLAGTLTRGGRLYRVRCAES